MDQPQAETPIIPIISTTRLREVPVSIVINGLSQAVMLASPFDLEDFALGFLLTEGLIQNPGQLLDLEQEQHHQGEVLAITLSHEALYRVQQRRRTLSGRSGCGLCGLEALDQAMPALPRLPGGFCPNQGLIQEAVAQLQSAQQQQQKSGGLHAAASFDQYGHLLTLREDVGRHNALDKLIGASYRQRVMVTEFVVLTSRCSYELIMKSARAGVQTLICLGRPTDLAVTTAQHCNINLLCQLGSDLHYFNLSTPSIAPATRDLP